MVKYIRCENCGSVFKSPAMDQKRFGYGLTIPGLGLVECPGCHERTSRKHYATATEEDYYAFQQKGKTEQPVQKSEKDLVDDSRYEDE